MKIIKMMLVLALVFCACDKGVQNVGPIKVYGTTGPTSADLALIYPQGLVGFSYKPRTEDLEYMPKNIIDLPIFGVSGHSMNIEGLLSTGVQIVVFHKNLNEEAKILEKYGIKTLELPYNGFDAIKTRIEMISSALEEFGAKDHKGALLLSFYERAKDLINRPVPNRPSIYFAFNVDGLSTMCGLDPKDEKAREDLAYIIGGKNAFKCEGISSGLEQINTEILLKKNPDVIFVREIALYEDIINGKLLAWKKLSAYKNKKIFFAPTSPVNWLTKPQNFMNILGFPWAINKLHPDVVSEAEVNAIVEDFKAAFFKEH